jgi:hypothetical protein
LIQNLLIDDFMRVVLVAVFLFTAIFSTAQNTIEWDGVYVLQLSDFQARTTQIGNVNAYSLHAPAGFDFSFYMTNAEFMFTKNFNAKVNCSFKRPSASIIAADSAMANELLNFARYSFDLSELYARKFRKELFEKKGAFSNVTFFQPIYDGIQKQYVERHDMAVMTTELGRKHDELATLHEEVKKEIAELPDFCKTCKPPKKKK